MSTILVNLEDTFDQWRKKTNTISLGVGDFNYIASGDTTVIRSLNRNFVNIGILESLTTILKSSLVDALNEVDNNTDINTISIGVLGNLTTSDKSSTVNAINELDGFIGDVPTLTTDSKSNLVVAVNEVDAHTDTNTTNIGPMVNLTNGPTLVDGIEWNLTETIAINAIIGNPAAFPIVDDIEANLLGLDGDITALETKVGADVLNTTASYTTGAINELYATGLLLGDLSLLTTTEKSNIVGAVNEVHAITIANAAVSGDLLLLDTGVKTDLVSAINEIAGNTVAMALILG